MSTMDRDWYRGELARRLHRAVPELRRRTRWCWLWQAVGVGVVILVVLAILPVAMTPRCDLATWRVQPVQCWRYSWGALSERTSDNMAASRGFPVVIVRTGS